MEGEKILMAAGVTAAVCSVAAFVFWGPSGLLSQNLLQIKSNDAIQLYAMISNHI